MDFHFDFQISNFEFSKCRISNFHFPILSYICRISISNFKISNFTANCKFLFSNLECQISNSRFPYIKCRISTFPISKFQFRNLNYILNLKIQIPNVFVIFNLKSAFRIFNYYFPIFKFQIQIPIVNFEFQI